MSELAERWAAYLAVLTDLYVVNNAKNFRAAKAAAKVLMLAVVEEAGLMSDPPQRLVSLKAEIEQLGIERAPPPS